MLGDDDAVLGGESAGDGAGGFHEGFPVAAGGVGFGAGIAGYQFGSFGGADGLVGVVGGTLGEEREDGLFEWAVMLGGVVAAACVGTEPEDVPVAGVLFGPADGALAGFAELFFVGGGSVGFGFAVGHRILTGSYIVATLFARLRTRNGIRVG